MAAKRKAGVLQDGARFVHPDHGECEVLPKGEWTLRESLALPRVTILKRYYVS